MKVIMFSGPTHRHRISTADWRLAGLGNDVEPVEWSWENGFGVDASRFTDDQMRIAIEPDPNFSVVEMDRLPSRLPYRMTPTQAANANVRLGELVGNPGSQARMPAPSSTTASTEKAQAKEK